MPLVLLFAFPAVVIALMWLMGSMGIQDDVGWTILVAFFGAVMICASLGQRWEARQASKRRYGPTS